MKYIGLTLKVCWKLLFLLIIVSIAFGFLINFSGRDFTLGSKFTLFGIKIGIIAIIIPYIVVSLGSFYEDIKIFEPEKFTEVAKYYRPQLIIIFCTTAITLSSVILDLLFFITCNRLFWDFGFGSLISGILGIIILTFYLLIKGIGEIEVLRKVGEKQISAEESKGKGSV